MLFLASCNQQTRLAIPTVFSEQATMMHVKGARGNKMSMEGFSISKVKRGIQWFSGSTSEKSEFSLENLLLNQVGVNKSKVTQKSKEKFRFTVSNGKQTMNVQAKETELTSNVTYKGNKDNKSFDIYNRLQEYSYIFSAIIDIDSFAKGKSWELLMTNLYDRRTDTVKGLFTIMRPDDNGLATNGKDTIFIKGVAINKTVSANGKEHVWPANMLGGYELSTGDGVIAIIDVYGRNIWFYNELETADRLIISAIGTAIFARTMKMT
jgi:hypothetical protein